MSFDIQVKIDPSQANNAAKSVVVELGKAEAAGVHAGKGISDALDKATSSGQRAAAAARAVGAAMKSLGDGIRAKSLDGVARSLDGLTSQLEREHRILEDLRAPMREYQADLRAIEMLHRKGELSAREYQLAIAEAGRRSGGGGVSMSKPAAKSSGFSAGSLMAGAGAVYAGAHAAGGIIGAADDNTAMENRLRSIVDLAGASSLSVEQLDSRLKGVMVTTRGELDATVGSFVSMSTATKSLGISQERVIAMTETLGKAFKVGGSSSEDAASAMRQLGQALASGRLQGDEFRSMMENAPFLMNQLSEALGVTVGKLREMSSAGQLTSKVVFEALEKQSGKISAAFAKTNATIGENIALAKTQAKVMGGEALTWMQKNISFTSDAEEAARGHVKAMQEQAAAAQAYQEELKKTGQDVETLGRKAAEAEKYKHDPLKYTNDLLTMIADTTSKVIALANESNAVNIRAKEIQSDFKTSYASLSVEIEANNKLIAEGIRLRMTDIQLAQRGIPGRAQATREKMEARQQQENMADPGASGARNMQHRAESLLLEQQQLIDPMQRRASLKPGDFGYIDPLAAKKRLHEINEELKDLYKIVEKAQKRVGVSPLLKLVGIGDSIGGGTVGAIDKLQEFMARASYYQDPENQEQESGTMFRDMFSGAKQRASAIVSNFTDLGKSPLAQEKLTGAAAGWEQITAQATDAAGAMESAMVNAYGNIESAMVDLVTKQKMDWKGLIDGILADLAKLAIRQAIAGFASGNYAQGITGLASVGGLAGIGMITGGGGNSARVAQPTSPTIGPAATNGVSARQSGGGTTIIVNQDRDALLPVLERPGGRRTVARIAVAEAGPALSRRPRYS